MSASGKKKCNKRTKKIPFVFSLNVKQTETAEITPSIFIMSRSKHDMDERMRMDQDCILSDLPDPGERNAPRQMWMSDHDAEQIVDDSTEPVELDAPMYRNKVDGEGGEEYGVSDSQLWFQAVDANFGGAPVILSEDFTARFAAKKKFKDDGTRVLAPKYPLKSAPAITSQQNIPNYLVQPYIVNGYRVNMNTCTACGSIFSLHNETVNIWTHFGALFVFLVIFISLLEEEPVKDFSSGDMAILSVYFAGICVCLLFSTCLHLFNCYTLERSENLSKLDHFGIIILLFASDLPIIYFGLECWPGVRLPYLILLPIVIALGLLAIWSDVLQDDRNRLWRLAAFMTVISFGIVHVIHETVLRGGLADADGRRVFLTWFLVTTMYAIGIFFYATNYPEKCDRRGTFDYFGSSHQLWHIFTIIGGLFHVHNVIQYIHYRDNCHA